MLVHHWEPTFSLNFSLRAANLAVRFSLFASIFWFSFSWACLLKLQLSSMAFWMTSFSCSRFSARCFSTSASWLWQTDKTTVALYRILNTRATLFSLCLLIKPAVNLDTLRLSSAASSFLLISSSEVSFFFNGDNRKSTLASGVEGLRMTSNAWPDARLFSSFTWISVKQEILELPGRKMELQGNTELQISAPHSNTL